MLRLQLDWYCIILLYLYLDLDYSGCKERRLQLSLGWDLKINLSSLEIKINVKGDKAPNFKD